MTAALVAIKGKWLRLSAGHQETAQLQEMSTIHRKAADIRCSVFKTDAKSDPDI